MLNNKRKCVIHEITMITYSHASTPLGKSERAYYLSYFIISINRKNYNFREKDK